LNLLEGYFFVHNFLNREKITFALLKAVPHVKYWWEIFCEQKEIKEPSLFTVMTTRESFRDAIKEQYYPVISYDDLYTKWTTLRQERDQAMPDFTNIFHTLCTKMGIKDSERHLVLNYRNALHRYIQTKIEFLDISSLGVAYRYVVKIEQKLKQKTRQFGPGNPSQQNPGKGGPNPHNKGQRKYG
jgi:glutamate synthase domain-containing protein 1